MYHVDREREKKIAPVLALADREPMHRDTDIRAIFVLLLAGIRYLVLHLANTKGTTCGIDVSTEEGMDRIRAALGKILDLAYSAR